jgi:UrcA family protein
MNTPKTAALAAATLILATTAIAAHAADAAPGVVLRYDAAAATTESGARDLYQRIAFAALQVCPAPVESVRASVAQARQCRHDAVSRAVAQVHEQRLVEIAAARARRG